MPAPDTSTTTARASLRRQCGATVVEFALIALLFFSFMFAVIELGRLLFLYNTLQEVTRRAAHAASVSDPGNAATLDAIRQNSIFRNTPGGLVMMSELTDQAVRIEYISVSRDASGNYAMQKASGSGPASAAENKLNCVTDPYAANCTRLVKVRICDPQTTASCEPMKFRPVTNLFNLELPLPMATTIVKAQSFGQNPG